MDDHVPKVRSVCACVVAAPLGWPVVPEVKMRSETSSGCTRRGPGRGHGGLDAGRPRRGSRPDRRPAPRQTPRWPSPPSSRNRTMRPQRAGVLPRQHGRVVDAQEPAHREEGRRARVAEDVSRLAALEARVQRHQHRAGPQRAQRGEHPLGAVGRPDGHAVARPDTGRHEAAGVAVDLGGQLRVGEAHARRRPAPRSRRAGPPRPPPAGAPCPRSGRPAGPPASGGAPPIPDAAHGCWLLTEMTSPVM